jgi:phage tail sheath protein FI
MADMELLHPGVYIREVSSGVQPIEGVSTSTTGFIGKAQMGPLNTPLLVTSFSEFTSNFGGFLGDSYLAHSALQFFANRGKRLYVVRVARNATVASVTLGDRQAAATASLTLAALSPGAWPDDITVVISNGSLDPANEFKLQLTRPTGIAETFDNLSMNPDAANFVERVVGAGSQLVAATALAVDTTVAGTSLSANTAATALPADRRSLVVNVDGDGPQPITLAGPCTSGGEVAAAIQAAVRALTPQRASTAPAAFTGFTAGFAAGVYTLTSGSQGKRSSVSVGNAPAGNAAALLKLGTLNSGTEATGAAQLRPAAGTALLSGAPVAGIVTAATVGSDGTTPQDPDYLNGFSAYDNVQDVNILAVPGIGTEPVVDFGTNYCTQRQDCFFVGDMAPTDDTPAEAQAFINSLATKTSYGAVYFPWLKMVDPTGQSATPILVPPSGFITGIYARIDSTRGVFKAPAGTEANVGGAVGLAGLMNDAQQDVLNPIGANLIRFFAASGIVVWGARTLATRSDPEYRYVPVRRLAIFLERSIYNGIQYAVFEPNDEPLWSSLRLNIGAFMMNQFRAGAFQGSTPSQAFFVKCDAETNPQSQIDAGIVTALVGFAPLKPAEFVVIQISQKAAGASS